MLFKTFFFTLKQTIAGVNMMSADYSTSGDTITVGLSPVEATKIVSARWCHSLNDLNNDFTNWTKSDKNAETNVFVLDRVYGGFKNPQTCYIPSNSNRVKMNCVNSLRLETNMGVYYTQKVFFYKEKGNVRFTTNVSEMQTIKGKNDGAKKSSVVEEKDNDSNKTLWIVMGSVLAGIVAILILVLIIKMCSAI